MGNVGEWKWVVKINGKIEACGWCFDKDEALTEAGHYFSLYAEEDFENISLIIKKKGG